jgi:hypothetical protein
LVLTAGSRGKLVAALLEFWPGTGRVRTRPTAGGTAITSRLFVTVAAVALVVGIGGLAVFLVAKPPLHRVASRDEGVWTEGKWPFPIDRWGEGWAFECKGVVCGTNVNLYLRPKIGFCNCQTGVADDEGSIASAR